MDDKLNTSKESTSNNFIAKLKFNFSQIPAKKKVQLLLLVIALVVVILLYFKSTNSSLITNNANTENNQFSTSSYYINSLDYCARLEDKLKKVLSNYSEINNVEVMITLSSSMELVFAESNETKNNSVINSDSYTVEVSSPIIINGNEGEAPLVVKEILPKIKGVLIVCDGADVATKMQIMQAVQSLLDINISKIQVLSRN